MKLVTCPQMGGPDKCDFVVTGDTAEEVVTKGFEHVKAAHPELAAQIQNNTPEENEKWMAEFRIKFDAMPKVE